MRDRKLCQREHRESAASSDDPEWEPTNRNRDLPELVVFAWYLGPLDFDHDSISGDIGMVKSIALGDILIQRVVESQDSLLDARTFFYNLTPEMLDENRSWMEPIFMDPATSNLTFCVQSYVVRTRLHTILIDSCVGNDKDLPNHPAWHKQKSDAYLSNLAKLGLTPADIDFVMCTHLHPDHVGWNTRKESGRWVPTFSNAKYLFSRAELEYWTKRFRENPTSAAWIGESVLPIVAAKHEQIVDSDWSIGDEIRLIPTPGHTIDHFSVLVGKPGGDALITGDMIHSPIQARYPEVSMTRDYDRALSADTRRRILDCYCDTSTLICTAHFPSPSVGRVTRWGEGFRLFAEMK